jgi:hypothetical protein
MSAYNFLNYDGKLVPSAYCKHDSNIGYEADFSRDGEVDGWDLFDGIHTYGCWNNFLFGTLYDTYAMIGRYEPLRPIEAEKFYTVRIVMKLNFKERSESAVNLPTKGRVAWRTIASPVWNSDKQIDFDIEFSNDWITYFINMGEAQWWQGDISDLRIWPILENGVDGDEFYIRVIEVLSVDSYRCLNVECDYWSNYEHNCPGIGERGYCKSKAPSAYTSEGTTFDFAGSTFFTITEGVNDTLLVNMNGYGYENVVLDSIENARGTRIANMLSKEISKLDVGGYAEAKVEYTTKGEFIIYNGVYAGDSTVVVGYNQLAKDLNFFDKDGIDISTKYVGSYPASGFVEYSSFKLKTHQIYSLLDATDSTSFYFNPFIYNVEGGRRDWLETGLGKPSVDVRTGEVEDSGTQNRYYDVIENNNKTVIDFTHPFNASGRIVKIHAALTLDNFSDGNWTDRGTNDSARINNQLQDAKIMFFRPLKNGDIRVLPMEVPIPNREHEAGKLYSAVQEYIDIDCDLFVNKGDLMGVYNANVYKSRTVSGLEVDALYYQVQGKASGDVQVRQPLGNGSAGLLMYARSGVIQNRLVLELDLGKRVNVETIDIIGSAESGVLEYNVARCLDINWEIDLFNGDWGSGWIRAYRPLKKAYYNHPTVAYGVENLTDGIKTVPDGLTADSFTVNTPDRGYTNVYHPGRKDGGPGVIPTNPRYFFVNGDCEWLAVWHHASKQSPFLVGDFNSDPIAFTLKFPFEKEKLISKFKIYFKEQYNFRSYSVSVYRGKYYARGTGDDPRFDLIPNRTDGYDTPWKEIIMDGVEYRPEDETMWDAIKLYMGENPIIGHKLSVATSILYADGGMMEGLDVSYWTGEEGFMSGYDQSFTITNGDQYYQSLGIDWTILEQGWKPLYGKGFRLHCNNHKSTKICEFEVYCIVENVTSALAGSIETMYSSYGDYWWPAKNSETTKGVRGFVGDTPQYANIIIKPITELNLSDIIVNASYDDVFMGEKGCQYVFPPTEAKRGVDNPSQKIEFKNTYGRPYDLYVDIAAPEISDEGTVFYSLMTKEEDIANPLIGADAYYRKHEDYLLQHYQKNVAINCPVWALKNLVDGADAWYSHDNNYSWKYYGKISEGNSLNFNNLPNAAITTINLPILTRSKWWKIGFFDPRIITTVREIQIYYQDEEIFGINFFHQKDKNVYSTPNTDTAPHLKNDIVDGSYYIIKGDHHIGFELPAVQMFDRIVIYHDYLLPYENSHDKAGIDLATALCIHGEGDTGQKDTLVDRSYFEHEVTVEGDVYCDETAATLYYDFTEEFDNCISTVQTFDNPPVDESLWTDLVQASIVSGTLNVTNSGIVGNATSTYYTYGDFNITVDLDMLDTYDGQGWGGFLEISNDDGFIAKVGKTFTYLSTEQGFAGQVFSTAGWQYINFITEGRNEGLRLQAKRELDLITFYVGVSGEPTVTLGSTNKLGYSPVKISLTSLYSPLTPIGAVTTAQFDNFTIDNSASDWNVDLSGGSTFTCVSGIGPTGYAYEFNIACRDSGNASGYKQCIVYDQNHYPFDEKFAFTFEFIFQTYDFIDDIGNSNNNFGFSAGILGKHVRYYNYTHYPWRHWFTGIQAVIRRDSVFIALRNEWTQSANCAAVALDTGAMPYYTRLTGDGLGHYELHIWTDDWDGANEVVNTSLDSDLRWTAYKVGIGSGESPRYNYTGRATGWVTDFNFVCDKYNKNAVIHKSSIKFEGTPGSKLRVGYDRNPVCSIPTDNFHFAKNKFTLDFFVSFDSLPENNGEYAVLMKSWGEGQPLTHNAPVMVPSSWAFIVINIDGGWRWQFYVNQAGLCKRWLDVGFNPDRHRWHHIYLCRGAENDGSNTYLTFVRDGHCITYPNVGYNSNVYFSGQDVIIGENFNGHMEEIRISSDDSKAGGRVADYFNYNEYIVKSVPTRQYERYYTMSFYESTDNVFYGKNFDVDILYDNSLSYHVDESYWSRRYYTYFAIDFGQRHDIGIIRSFPINSSYQFTLTDNILYSKKDTADPVAAFNLTEAESNLDTDFTGPDNTYPSNWTKYDTAAANSYIIDDLFYMSCSPNATSAKSEAQAKFYFYEDFDINIDYLLSSTHVNNNSWKVIINLQDLNNDKFAVRFIRAYIDGSNHYRVEVKDNSTSWSTITLNYTSANEGTMRVIRTNQVFEFYLKSPSQPFESFTKFTYHNMQSTFSPETHLSLQLESAATTYPSIEVWWDNFTVTKASPLFSTSKDARWARVKMLNGDGTLRTIESAGIYPNINTQLNAYGQSNCHWEPLGTSITSYAAAENIALGATTSGSSTVGVMYPFNVVDGVIPEGDFNECWGAFHDDDGMWISVHFNEVKEIFRFKIFHGYASEDFNNIITDYRIQVSEDGQSFTTIFDINSNNSMIRTHDLAYPVSAKVVRLWVDNYKAINRFLYTGEDTGYQFWMGPCLREIEIYEYYGFTVINSEDTPVIAIDLRTPYFVEGHELIGIDTENKDIEWAHDDGDDPNYDDRYIPDGPGVQFAWSNSHLTDPKKVRFSEWGADPGYSKWVVIKRNTATKYPRVPRDNRDYDDTPDYLKHVVIKASVNEYGKAPNPVEYPWFWRSNFSDLSYDYDNQTNTGFIARSLKIEYPASTEVEHVRYIEGDTFGWDAVTSWRDGFGFFIYIDDINNLDLDYGYFYLGGFDYTEKRNPVVHRWNLTTFSGVLQSGWNNLNLTFLYADSVIYTELDYAKNVTGRDPRILYSINWGRVGFIFRGKGNPIKINFEGFFIERNHFEHGCFPLEKGLYLHANDVMKVPIGELSFHSGAIEFFIRPDWSWDGRDIYGDFKFRTLLHFGNIANDIFGAAISTHGIEVYYGNLLTDFNVFTITGLSIPSIDKLLHMAFVFSNDGKGIALDGSTVRVYINNQVVGKHYDKWKVSDDKHFNFFLGGQGLLVQKMKGFDPTSSAVDGVVARLKIHNYCKTDYSDSMPAYGGTFTRKVLKPDDFIAISKDNVTFHKVGSAGLPFFFDDVPAGNSIPIWVRVNVPRFGLTGHEKRTAEVLGSWDIGV